MLKNQQGNIFEPALCNEKGLLIDLLSKGPVEIYQQNMIEFRTTIESDLV